MSVRQLSKKQKVCVESRPFFVDKKGDKNMKRKKSKFRQTSTKTTVIGNEDSDERERELAINLFGYDADVQSIIHSELPCSDTFSDTFHSELKQRKKLLKNENIENSQFLEDEIVENNESVDQQFRRPAWVDDDDENIRVKDVVGSMAKAHGKRGDREISDEQYEVKLREKFSQVFGDTPDWARMDKAIEVDSDDEDMAMHTCNYLSNKISTALPKNVLQYKKVADLNGDSLHEGPIIRGIEFNTSYPVALVTGDSKTNGAAAIFQVDGKDNPTLQTIKFPCFPITSAHFLAGGKKFVVGSNFHGHFFVYDLEAGKQTRIPWFKANDRPDMKKFVVSPDGTLLVYLGKGGLMHLFDSVSLSLVEKLKAPSMVRDATFSRDGGTMYTHGVSGEVFLWDMGSRRCSHKFYDDGCTSGTSIAVSPSNQYLACGSSAGIVNVYDLATVCELATPQPIKVLDKLLTPVTSLEFNATSEVLAMASDQKDSAFKLAHFPSMTFFNNFPGPQKNLRRPHVLAFSPNSGYIAAGNNGGRAFLYRLKHYPNY